MKLSTPIYHLKRKARLLSRKQNIPLHQALDLIAGNEGFSGWSLLAAKAPSPVSARELFATLNPGGLVLIGARPGQGKTLLSLELAVEAMKIGNRSAFFTLEYTEYDVTDRLRVIDRAWERFRGFFDFDSSDDISSDYIIEKLASAKSGTVAIVDYLQLLDQKREKPALAAQIAIDPTIRQRSRFRILAM